MTRPSIKTSRKKISDYWKSNPKAEFLNLDWSNAHNQCWRCNYKKGIQRCHIVPHPKSSNDDPSNLILLCTRCHKEAPNVSDPDIMWDWLWAYCHNRTELNLWVQRIIEEYKFIYDVSPTEEMAAAGATKAEFESFAENTISGAVIHFGEGRLNISTMVGLLRMFIKEKRANNMPHLT